MHAIIFEFIPSAFSPAEEKKYHLEVLRVLQSYGFSPVQNGFFLRKEEDLAVLFSAMRALKGLPWFPPVVKSLYSFRVESWSDFSQMIKN